ncbi:MAG: hypothetical protein HY923_02835 [Elusimicrobia bacterium]|nr:hypothetical protein [Elusimicrobiota bacterium]
MKILLMLALLAGNAGAKKAPQGMTRFNETCPVARLLPVLEDDYAACSKKEKTACDGFVSGLRELLPEYDCQRPFDAGPPDDYIVPAIWKAGDAALAKYVALLASLKTKKALELFASPEFRAILDGHLAETYMERSRAAQKRLKVRRP